MRLVSQTFFPMKLGAVAEKAKEPRLSSGR